MQMYFLCYATACLIVVGSPIGGPKWSRDYDRSIEAARSHHRPLLLLMENGADPSSKFELADVEGSSEAAELLGTYETCRLDVQTEDGRLIAEGYGVSEYPCVLISDEGCRRIVFRGAGQLSASFWRQTLASYAGRPSRSAAQVAENDSTGAEHSEAEGAGSKVFRRASLETAQRTAKTRRRPLIVYVGTDNCPFCDKMRHETLRDRGVMKAVAADFESVAVEQRDEVTWTEQQGLRIYPTTLVFGSDGELLDRMEGFVRPSDFLQRLQMSRQYLLSSMW